METQIELPTIPKENAFNAIRFILCLVVVFMHTLGNVNIGNKYLLDGHMAVCGFFIISGFWVTKSYFLSENLKTFFIKRIKKILPMYYISVIGISIICVFFSSLSVQEYFGLEYAKYLFWNCLFLNFMHPNLPGCFEGNAVNGALWTIKVEIGFYIILPLIIYFWKRIKSQVGKNIYFIALYVLSVIYNMVLKKYAEQWHLPYQLSYQLPGFISFFVSGIFIFLNWDKFLKFKKWMIIPSIAVYFIRYFTNTEILFPAAFAIIIVWSALVFKKLNFIGKDIDFSWGIYLFHFPLMQMLFYSAEKNVNIPLYVTSVLGIAFMLTYMVEKYIQKKIK
mgnify:FL=1